MSLDAVTACNLLVRRLVTDLLGLDDGFMRPANQRKPAGAGAFGTVNIIDVDMLSWNYKRVPPTDPDALTLFDEPPVTDMIELVDPLQKFTASVNFWRDGAVDEHGRATYGCGAVARATRLVALLRSSYATEQARGYGLGYVSASPVRDLSMSVDGFYENRGQVDLQFHVSDTQAFALAAFQSLQWDIIFQAPDNYTHEVTS